MEEFNKIFKFHFVKCQKNNYFYVKVLAPGLEINGNPLTNG